MKHNDKDQRGHRPANRLCPGIHPLVSAQTYRAGQHVEPACARLAAE